MPPGQSEHTFVPCGVELSEKVPFVHCTQLVEPGAPSGLSDREPDAHGKHDSELLNALYEPAGQRRQFGAENSSEYEPGGQF